jgi:hypothetical protein
MRSMVEGPRPRAQRRLGAPGRQPPPPAAPVPLPVPERIVRYKSLRCSSNNSGGSRKVRDTSRVSSSR